MKNNKNKPKIILWDIETCWGGIESAGRTAMHCIGWKELGSKNVQCISQWDFKGWQKDIYDDKKVVEAAYKVLSDADAQIFHYGCVAPEHKILTADLRYVRADSLKVGDKLLGFDADTTYKSRRKIKESTVTHAKIITKPRVKIILSDGTILKVSLDHPFLVPHGKRNGANWNWKQARELKVGDVLTRSIPTWEEDRSYDSGYLSGIYDGEGSFAHKKNKDNTSLTKLGFAQLDNKALEQTKNSLFKLGFSFAEYTEKRKGLRSLKRIHLTPNKFEILRFLGTVRPKRLLNNFDANKVGSLYTDLKNRTSIISIENIGRGKVVGLSTSSETYISEGFASHNSRFDLPYLNSRLMYHGLPPLPKIKTVDTWRVSKDKLHLYSNRLDSIAEFFGLPRKLHIGRDTWNQIVNRDLKACKKMTTYCKQDVIVLEKVFNKLRPVIDNIPNYNLFTNQDNHVCHNCGSKKVHSKGNAVTKTASYKRYQCQDCGSWGRFDKKDKSPRGL